MPSTQFNSFSNVAYTAIMRTSLKPRKTRIVYEEFFETRKNKNIISRILRNVEWRFELREETVEGMTFRD